MGAHGPGWRSGSQGWDWGGGGAVVVGGEGSWNLIPKLVGRPVVMRWRTKWKCHLRARSTVSQAPIKGIWQQDVRHTNNLATGWQWEADKSAGRFRREDVS